MTKLLALTLAAAASAAAAAAATTPSTYSDYLIVDQPTLDMSTGAPSYKVNVRLREKPTARTVVYPESPNTRFDRCALEFTPDNFDKPQELVVVGEPNSKEVAIEFSSYSDQCDEKHHGRKYRLPTRRGKQPSKRCTVTADPHYTTFENPYFNYQGVGDFYLVKSETLAVMARQGRCIGKTSCVTAVAVRYGDASFVIDSAAKTLDQYVQVVTHSNGCVVSKTRSGTTFTVNIALNGGSNIKIDAIDAGGRSPFMNVYIDAAQHHKGKLNGLCGHYSGNRDTCFKSPRGDVYKLQEILRNSGEDPTSSRVTFPKTDLYKYGEEWRVPDSDNIFKCRDNCSDKGQYKPVIDREVAQCRAPQPDKVVCDKPKPTLSTSATYAPPPSSSKPVTSTYMPPPPPQPPVPSTSTSSTTTVPPTTSDAPTTVPPSTTVSPSSSTGPSSSQPAPSSSSSQPAPSSSSSTTSVAPSTTYVPPPAPSTQPPAPTTTTTSQPPVYSTTTSTYAPAPKPSTTVCPKPTIVLPVPPGYKHEITLPRYSGPEPKAPATEAPAIPEAPREVLEEVKKQCARRIAPVASCTEDVQRYVAACEMDITSQMNPDAAVMAANLAYTDACAKEIIGKCKSGDAEEAKKAVETALKHSFGATKCDDKCQQCTDRGCIQCKDNERYEPQAGRCVERPRTTYPTQYFAPAAEYKALADHEVVAPNTSDDPAAYGLAVQANSVSAAMAGQSGESDTPKSSSSRVQVSAVFGAVVLAALFV